MTLLQPNPEPKSDDGGVAATTNPRSDYVWHCTSNNQVANLNMALFQQKTSRKWHCRRNNQISNLIVALLQQQKQFSNLTTALLQP